MHIEFDDYRRNGEGLAVYEAGQLDGLYSYPPDAALVFHVDDAAAYLSAEDVDRLRAALDDWVVTGT